MSEPGDIYGGGEFGPPAPPPDDLEALAADDFDRSESGEASPEMQAAAEKFEHNLRQIFEARDKATRAKLRRGEAADDATAHQECVELEQAIIRAEIDHAEETADLQADYARLGWDSDKVDSSRIEFLQNPNRMIREEIYLDSAKQDLVHHMDYSVADGWIFKEFEFDTDRADDVGPEDETPAVDNMPVDQREARPIDLGEEVTLTDFEDNGDLNSRPITLDAARTLAAMSSRLRAAILNEYRRQGLLEPAKS